MSQSPAAPSTAAFLIGPDGELHRAYGELVFRRCRELGLRNVRQVGADDLAAATSDCACIVVTEGAAAGLSDADVARLAEWVEGGGWLVIIAPPPSEPALALAGLAAQAQTITAEPGLELDFEPVRAVPAGSSGPAHPIWGEAILGRISCAGARAVMSIPEHHDAPALVTRTLGRGRVLSYQFTLGATIFHNQSGRGVEHLPYPKDRHHRTP